MKRRKILRAAALAGCAAILAQAAGYTILARSDERGTSKRWFSLKAGDGRLKGSYPNTWTRSVPSRQPELRVLLSGPRGSQIQIAGSSSLLSIARMQEDKKKDPLPVVHRAFAGISSAGLTGYKEDAPEVSHALPSESLLSFIRASRGGKQLRGFRYTMISGDRVWSVLALTPEDRWRQSLPVLRDIVKSLRFP